MVKNDKLKKIIKSRKMLDKEYKMTLVNTIQIVLTDDVERNGNGYGIEELSSIVLNKNYTSLKDRKTVYECITILRKIQPKCIRCKNGKYGYALTKEEIDAYVLSNIHNGILKVKHNINKIRDNYLAIGCKENTTSMIQENLKQNGLKLLE